LETEETLGDYFTDYIGISKALYSERRQKENLKLVENNLMPFLKKQLSDLGFGDEVYKNLKLEFEKDKNETLNMESLIEKNAFMELKKLSATNDGKYFLISVLEDNEAIKMPENENLKIFNINREINEALDKTAKTAIKMALIAYAVIFAIMTIFFNNRLAFGITLVQVISVLINLSVHSVFGININIFSIFALILSIGISIDYCIFFLKSKAKKEVTFLAMFLSMATTISSFGTLSFSGFIPVKSFGLFLFIGISISFILSPILLKFEKTN